MRRGALTAAGTALVLSTLSLAGTARADDERSPSVGLPARIDQIVLPGSELVVRPLDDPRAPIVLRIAATYPHGDSFRYDLVYYGLEAGVFDLGELLQRKDGTPTGDLPSVAVTIRPLLPSGRVEPNPLQSRRSPALGGYRTRLVAGVLLWVLGLAAILVVGRRRAGAGASGLTEGAALSLAERLRPMVEDALAGRLSGSGRAELERLLLAYWRRRLGLGRDVRADEAMAVLRAHAEAGQLIRQLETWLHRPPMAATAVAKAELDVADLLRPYRDLPAEALESSPTNPDGSAPPKEASPT